MGNCSLVSNFMTRMEETLCDSAALYVDSDNRSRTK